MSNFSQPRRAMTSYSHRMHPERMFTETGLISEAKNFLNGKNLFDGNLMENKLFAYQSIQYCKDIDVSQEQDDLNIDIDDELDNPSDYASTMKETNQLHARSRRFRSTGFDNYEDNEPNRAQTVKTQSMRTTKYKIKSLRTTGKGKSSGMVKFGSSKILRKKMGKINKNISKLHGKSLSNWSKNDLNKKFLLNGSNFRDNYNRSTHTLFDQMKTQQYSAYNGKPQFNGVMAGSPYTDNNLGLQLKSKVFSSKSSIDIGKGKTIPQKGFNLNTVQAINQALNKDQKMSYLLNRQNKYVKTNTTCSNGGRSNRVHRKNNPFSKDFGFNTQTKLKIGEVKRPQTSAVNHSRDMYDPLTRARQNKTSAEKGYKHPRNCNKSQTISGFAHLGRIFAPNFSNEYQKAISANSNHFRRAKGM